MSAPATDKQAVSASDLRKAIASRYCAPEWYVQEEVTYRSRRLDVVAFNLWGARKYNVVGFELKVSRSDWLRELKAFEKAEGWWQIVDAFYIVAPAGLVKPEELPAGWGLLQLHGGALRAKVTPTYKAPAETLPRELVARFLGESRRKVEQSLRTIDWEAREQIRSETKRQVEGSLARELVDLRENNRKYQLLLDCLGLTYEWKPDERVITLVALLAKLDADKTLVAKVHRVVQQTGEHIKTLEELARELATTGLAEVPA